MFFNKSKLVKRAILFIVLVGAMVGVVGCRDNRLNIRTETETITEEYTTPIVEQSILEQFMEEKGAVLTAKDVQYDMKNNLDKKFGMEGTAELSTYYNYGFDDSMEDSYFVISFTPEGGDYSDQWHLYCDRVGFATVLDKLKRDGSVYMYTIAEVPSGRFKKGQGNMAILKHSRGYY